MTNSLPQQLSLLQEAFSVEPYPDLAIRQDRLLRLKSSLKKHYPQLLLAMSEDFGGRSRQESLMADLIPVISEREAVAFIRQRPRPLALYYLGNNSSHQQQLEYQTHSGSLAIKETLLQVAQHDLPFGGVGASGMGQYHGREGFLTFSRAKSVFQRRLFNSTQFIYPPYGRWIHRLMERWFMR